jgi:hypothetical protein
MKVMIEVNIPVNGTKAEAEMAVKRYFDPDWMAEWWCTDDVIEQACEDISTEEARWVLQMMEKRHDCNHGHTWDSMDYWIEKAIEKRGKNDC